MHIPAKLLLAFFIMAKGGGSETLVTNHLADSPHSVACKFGMLALDPTSGLTIH